MTNLFWENELNTYIYFSLNCQVIDFFDFTEKHEHLNGMEILYQNDEHFHFPKPSVCLWRCCDKAFECSWVCLFGIWLSRLQIITLLCVLFAENIKNVLFTLSSLQLWYRCRYFKIDDHKRKTIISFPIRFFLFTIISGTFITKKCYSFVHLKDCFILSLYTGFTLEYAIAIYYNL